MMHIRKLLIRFFRPLFVVRVHGESAWPVLVPGKTYFASSLFSPWENDFIVVKDPRNKNQFMVKKIAGVTDEGYQLESLVSWGSSSKDFGPVKKDFVLGTILLGRQQ